MGFEKEKFLGTHQFNQPPASVRGFSSFKVLNSKQSLGGRDEAGTTGGRRVFRISQSENSLGKVDASLVDSEVCGQRRV